MPSLISTTERANLTGIFNDIFDTFQRAIIVYKEPTKTQVVVDTSNFIYGFGENQAQAEYTYQERTGVFPATIRYANRAQEYEYRIAQDTNIKIPEGAVSIKVKQECKDFLTNDITEKIIVDGKTYYMDSDQRSQNFLDSKFWVFILKPTK